MLWRIANYVIDGGQIGGNLRRESLQRMGLHCGLVYLGQFRCDLCLVSYFNFWRFEHRLRMRLRRHLVCDGTRMAEIPCLLNMLRNGISLVDLQSLSEGIIIWPQLDVDEAGLGGELVGLGGGGVGPGGGHQVGLEVVPPVLPRRDLEQCGPLSLVEECRGLSLIGRECCWRQLSYAIKNQLVASKAPY